MVMAQRSNNKVIELNQQNYSTVSPDRTWLGR